jgi:WxcM-like, C-terminal
MLCVKGTVDIVCDDGRARKTLSLDHPELALFVPPGLCLEIMPGKMSRFIVLCDRPYEEHDYIRNYAEFLSFRKALRA